MPKDGTPVKRKAATVIGREEAGRPLLDWLAARFTYHSIAEWTALIADGALLVNGMPGEASIRVAAGDTVEYLVPPHCEPSVDDAYTVVYEDEALLVVDKPPGLPCHPAGRFFQNTLWALLLRDRGEPMPHFVNRLDRETSGLVLLAKDAESARRCQVQFAGERVAKRYLAIVEGQFPEGTLEANGVLDRDPDSRLRKKHRFRLGLEASATGLVRAATTCRTLERQGGLTLIEAMPHTGRTHQIRATLAALGFPVVGDKMYGSDETIFLRFARGELTAEDRRRLRLERQALHAAELRLRHPLDGTPRVFQSPLPTDLRALLADGNAPRVFVSSPAGAPSHRGTGSENTPPAGNDAVTR